MKKIASVALALGLAACAPLPPTQSASQRLDALQEEAFQKEMDLYPVFETFRLGRGPRQGKWEANFNPGNREQVIAMWKSVQERLKAIPVSELSGTDLVTHAILARRASEAIEAAEFPSERLGILSQIRGLPFGVIVLATATQPMETEADFEAWLTRSTAMAATVDPAIGILREDLARGLTVPRALVEKTLRQVDALTNSPIERTPLWAPLRKFPALASAETRASWEKRYREMLESQMRPAFARFGKFVREEYLPKARTTSGIGALPGGEAAYRQMLRSNTTTDLTPDEIHALGLREIARIQPLMLAAASKVGYTGAMKDLSPWLEKDAKNNPFKTEEEEIAYLKKLHAQVMPQIPKMFNRQPKAAFDIRPVDAALAATSAAHYNAPSADGTKPGIFYLPTVDARTQQLARLAAVLLHEGVPGHHFDNGLKREMNLPNVRKYGNIPAYGEGWGLYAESLGHDLGVYDEPYALVGRYYLELWRAGRLVVDTGMHAKGWTREQAITYMVENTSSPLDNATSEVERYMANPGQACAYKIGELTILDLRNAARSKLGAKFDLREFHDVILEESHMPLALLRERVNAWIARKS